MTSLTFVKSSLCLLFAVTVVAPVQADTIILKNGKQIEGIVHDDGGPSLEVKTDCMDMAIAREQVKEIRRESPPYFFMKSAEASFKAGDYPAARAAYKQALDLDPKNSVALKQIEVIDSLPMRRQVNDDKVRSQQAIARALAQAEAMIDRALDDEALETLKMVLEKDPKNVKALQLASETSSRLFSRMKVPESLVETYLTRLKALKPDEPSIVAIRQSINNFKEKQKLTMANDKKILYAEIVKAHEAKKYDVRLVNKIDRLLEMAPDQATKDKMAEVRKAALDAGVGRMSISVTSSTDYKAAPEGAPRIQESNAAPVAPTPIQSTYYRPGAFQ